MIRYQITATELKKRVDHHKKGWLKRAATRTKGFEAAVAFLTTYGSDPTR